MPQVRLESGPAPALIAAATLLRAEQILALSEVLDIDVEHVVGTALDVVIWDLPGAGTRGPWRWDGTCVFDWAPHVSSLASFKFCPTTRPNFPQARQIDDLHASIQLRSP